MKYTKKYKYKCNMKAILSSLGIKTPYRYWYTIKLNRLPISKYIFKNSVFTFFSHSVIFQLKVYFIDPMQYIYLHFFEKFESCIDVSWYHAIVTQWCHVKQLYMELSKCFQTFLYRHLKLSLTFENSLCYCYTSYEMTDQFLWFQVQMNSYSRNRNTPY